MEPEVGRFERKIASLYNALTAATAHLSLHQFLHHPLHSLFLHNDGSDCAGSGLHGPRCDVREAHHRSHLCGHPRDPEGTGEFIDLLGALQDRHRPPGHGDQPLIVGAAALQVTKSAQRFAVRAEAAEQNVDVEEVVKDLQEKVSRPPGPPSGDARLPRYWSRTRP
jgi:hypothetical protein